MLCAYYSKLIPNCFLAGRNIFGHNGIVLDLTSLAYQPKSRERSPHPRRRVTFARTDKKKVYPAHTPELDEDDDEKPLVRPNRAIVSEDEDDKPLVQSTSRTKSTKEKRESAAARRTPAQSRRRKGPPVWRDPSVTLKPDVSGNARERSEEGSIFVQKSRR